MSDTQLTPVDYDPFAGSPTLTPVDNDPFASSGDAGAALKNYAMSLPTAPSMTHPIGMTGIPYGNQEMMHDPNQPAVARLAAGWLSAPGTWASKAANALR